MKSNKKYVFSLIYYLRRAPCCLSLKTRWTDGKDVQRSPGASKRKILFEHDHDDGCQKWSAYTLIVNTRICL